MKLSLKENTSNVTLVAIREELYEKRMENSAEEWLKYNISQDSIGNVIAEITDMGGYCDCEVLLNYHEDYEIN